MRGLNTGSLILRFEREGFATVFWNRKPGGTTDRTKALPISTTAGKAVTGIDLVVPGA